jgi:hypothetical protein
MVNGPLGSNEPAPGYQYKQGRSRVLSAVWVAPPLGTATAVHAAVTDNAGTQTITTAITNPSVARTIVATPGGTTANVTAVSVTVTGTNIYGDVISEVLPAFSAGAATAKTSLKAFATVTSISQPAIGTGVTVSYGTGPGLGLPQALARDTIVAGFLNGVREATRPTAVASTDISKNIVTLTSALNGTDVVVDYYS